MDVNVAWSKRKMVKKKKGGGGGGADEDERRKGDGDEAVVVPRMELHCDGCALKVRKAIRGAQGAASVRTDVAAGTVTVAGKADPWDLRDRILARHKPAVDVAFVSPANPPRPPPKPKEQETNNKADGGANNDKQTPPPPPESTVVLSIQLHCKGCADRIKRRASKIEGVKQVTVDAGKEQVTVKGTMDAKALPDVLSAKLKRPVTAVVPPPMTNKNKAATGGGPNSGHDDNREQGEEAGGNKNKNKNWQQQQQQREAGAVDVMSVPSEELQYPTIFPASYGRDGSVGSSYRVQLLQGPQPFSDDNPNACCLM